MDPMKLTEEDALARLAAHDHAVLSTLHPQRGIDSVPVVYAVSGRLLAVPIDTVKPKSSTRLRRQDNVDADPRATLLADQWDRDDWSRLWWVRAHLERVHDDDAVPALSAALAARYPQYRDQPFESVMVFRIVALYGWAATGTGYGDLNPRG